MSGLRLAVEDRKTDAVAHLAAARSQNTGPAFWGNLLKIKTAVSVQLSFLLRIFRFRSYMQEIPNTKEFYLAPDFT